MRYFLTAIACIFCSISFAQNGYFNDGYNKLLEGLSSENWTESEKICKELLAYVEPIDSMQHEKKVLRYMYIYATAGLLNDQKITKTEA